MKNERLQRLLEWVGIVLMLAAAFFLGRVLPKQAEPSRTVRDTITVHDTIRDSIPVPFTVRFDHYDTLYVPIYIDTTTADSVLVPVTIPIERKEYRTEDYRAVISGYRPSLDVMEVFRKTKTVTVTPKPKRWGIGPQVGIGVPLGWYVGIGISYDIWQW